MAAQWPMSRLVRLWNGLPGVTPVKRFTDRQIALNRIWKALATDGQFHYASQRITPESRTLGETHDALKIPARRGRMLINGERPLSISR